MFSAQFGPCQARDGMNWAEIQWMTSTQHKQGPSA